MPNTTPAQSPLQGVLTALPQMTFAQLTDVIAAARLAQRQQMIGRRVSPDGLARGEAYDRLLETMTEAELIDELARLETTPPELVA